MEKKSQYKKNLFSHVGFQGCLPLFYEDEHFAVVLDLLYTICMVPVENVVEAFDNIAIPFFWNHFPNSEKIDDFLNYVERTYIGRKLRGGERGNPLFSIEMWNIGEQVLQDKQELALGGFTRENMKEFMYMLREDV